jgi:hypothetical protein
MDTFEQVVAEILWREGYWVRTSVKVDLTKGERRGIELPSSPRWELNVVAYRAKDNDLKIVERKSYFDSRGVRVSGFNTDHADWGQYKLFNRPRLRDVGFRRLRQQSVESGACLPRAIISLCLARGRIATETDRHVLRKRFEQEGWELWDESWLRERWALRSDGRYENQVSAVVAKLLLRGNV